MGISPPARKLASWPLYAIRFGSARLWKNPRDCSALIRAPIPWSRLKKNRLRKSLKTRSGASAGFSPLTKPGAGNCCVVARPASSGRVPKKFTPSSVSARRLTSANRTCSITCWLSWPLGSCSMLMTFIFEELACAISAARSAIWLVETPPDSTMASSVALTWMSSPGKSARSCCCKVVTAGSTARS